MSTPALPQDLQHLIGDVYAALIALRGTKGSAAIAHPVAPTLQAVMRSSRARAWIPPHLIESLQIR